MEEDGFLKEREPLVLNVDIMEGDVSVEDYLKRLCALYVDQLMQHATEKILEFRMAADEAKAEMRAMLAQHASTTTRRAATAARA